MEEPRPPKPVVLHIGDPIKYNPEVYARFSAAFTVVRPSLEERQRPQFVAALRDGRWGDFAAVFRPFWSTGGEMGRWDAELIACLPRSVRVFASAGAGFDWADVDVLAEHGMAIPIPPPAIPLPALPHLPPTSSSRSEPPAPSNTPADILYCNSSLASTESVADFALLGIISTFRHLPWLLAAAPSPSSFTTCHHDAPALSRNPRNHSLAIIGLGNVGRAVAAKAAAAFDMRILYFGHSRQPPDVEAAAGHATFVPDLHALLAQADCVVLAVPAPPGGGPPLIDARALAAFRPGARLVNLARGALVDEEALADALDSGQLSAAMLDVHAREPEVNARLCGRRDVLLTCHNAGGTLDTYVGFERLSMENVEAVVLRGEVPASAVNARLMKEERVMM